MKLSSQHCAVLLLVAAVLPHAASVATSCLTTKSGCKCLNNWSFGGYHGLGGCIVTGDNSNQAWCAVDSSSCSGSKTMVNGSSSFAYDVCNTESSGDSCVQTVHGCKCRSNWSYLNYTSVSGCANPDGDQRGSWCMVDQKTCNSSWPQVYQVQDMSDNVIGFYDFCGIGGDGTSSLTTTSPFDIHGTPTPTPATVVLTSDPHAGSLLTAPKKKYNWGPVIGGAIGGAVGLVAIAGLVAWLFSRKRRSQ